MYNDLVVCQRGAQVEKKGGKDEEKTQSEATNLDSHAGLSAFCQGPLHTTLLVCVHLLPPTGSMLSGAMG